MMSHNITIGMLAIIKLKAKGNAFIFFDGLVFTDEERGMDIEDSYLVLGEKRREMTYLRSTH